MFGREPVAISTAIRSVILVGVAFGLQWSAEQVAAVMLAVEATLVLLVRREVTPVNDPRTMQGERLVPASSTEAAHG